MKLVPKNIDEVYRFERGKDPKESMDIGMLNKRDFSSPEELAQWILDLRDKLDFLDIKGSDFFLQRPMNWDGDDRVWVLNKQLRIMLSRRLCQNFYINGDWILRWGMKLRKVINYIEDALYEEEKINESISFERGKDPKEALDIGIEKSLYKFLDSVDQWTSSLDHMLITVSKYGKFKFIPYLVDKGADPNTVGGMPLKIAVNNADLDTMEVLLESGANPDFISFTSFKRRKTKPEVIDLLKKYGLKLDESISFKRGKDPKRAIGVGRHQHFTTVRKAMEYVAHILPDILGTEEIPHNIIRSKNLFINGRYQNRISKYINKYITWDYNIDGDSWNIELFHILQDRGFLWESIEFERGKDPKEAMNIGLENSGNTLNIRTCWSHSDLQTHEVLSDPWKALEDGLNLLFHDQHGSSWTLDYLMGINPRYKASIFDHGYDYAHFQGRYYKLNPNRLELKESVSFKRGRDPKSTLGIGMSWDNLRPGVIIRLNKNILGIREKKGDIYKITDVKSYKTQPGIKIIFFEEAGDNFESNQDLDRWEMSKLFFERNFEIVGLQESISFKRDKSVHDIKKSLRGPIPGDLFSIVFEDREDQSDILVYLGPVENPYNNKVMGGFWRLGFFINLNDTIPPTFIWSKRREPAFHLRDYFMESVNPLSEREREFLLQEKDTPRYKNAVKMMQDYLGKNIEPIL